MYAISALFVTCAYAADLFTLNPTNFDAAAPKGKEADAIYGDYLIRNDILSAAIFNPDLITGRSASRATTGGPGRGNIVDLTFRQSPNDQLLWYDPGPVVKSKYSVWQKGTANYHADYADDFVGQTGDSVSLSLQRAYLRLGNTYCPADYVYQVKDGSPFVRVSITYRHPSFRKTTESNEEESTSNERPVEVEDLLNVDATSEKAKESKSYKRVADEISFVCPGEFGAYRNFEYGTDFDDRLFWAYDRWFGQAYGVIVEDHKISYTAGPKTLNGPTAVRLGFRKPGQKRVTLRKETSYSFVQYIFPGRDLFDVKRLAARLLEIKTREVNVTVNPPDADAPSFVRVTRGKQIVGAGYTGEDGTVTFKVQEGKFDLSVSREGAAEQRREIPHSGDVEFQIAFAQVGKVRATIVDADGQPIPCKVAFHGIGDTVDPNFFPESGDFLVRNLAYTPNGRFECPVAPGRYRVVITRGPEYDAVYQEVDVLAGEVTELNATLRRTVDTTGWISADLHTHTTVSGTSWYTGSFVNTQSGRVLNLASEHIEFAPTTEHNTISTYEPVIRKLGLEKWLASCPGIGLTPGYRKYSWNHQNAFPMIYQPHVADGGFPQRPQHCLQLAWLAAYGAEIDPNEPWATARFEGRYAGSEKLIQVTYDSPPRKPTWGDNWLNADGYSWLEAPFAKDVDRDGEIESTWVNSKFIDVLDVQSLLPLIDPKRYPSRTGGILDWLTLLKSGHRFGAVCNSGATDNYHGCGDNRNYIRSDTDSPSEIKTMDVVHTLKARRSLMTTGPFLDVRVQSAGQQSVGVGEELRAESGKVELSIRVQCPNWIDVDRVRVLKNSAVAPDLDFTRQRHPTLFSKGTVRFELKKEIELQEDTHLIVIATGSGPNLRKRKDDEADELPHIAVTNPIWIDVGEHGFEPHPPSEDCVRSSLVAREFPSPNQPGTLDITLTNVRDITASGVFSLRVQREEVANVIGKNEFRYSLKPGEKVVMKTRIGLDKEFLTEASISGEDLPKAITIIVPRNGKGTGLGPSNVEMQIVKSDLESISDFKAPD